MCAGGDAFPEPFLPEFRLQAVGVGRNLPRPRKRGTLAGSWSQCALARSEGFHESPRRCSSRREESRSNRRRLLHRAKELRALVRRFQHKFLYRNNFGAFIRHPTVPWQAQTARAALVLVAWSPAARQHFLPCPGHAGRPVVGKRQSGWDGVSRGRWKPGGQLARFGLLRRPNTRTFY